ncbi:hypothetical protein IFM89_021314 [Coptis chinensis]|uniref:Uncharacterized protein n=1 Tax=Coptis chinensis TaxID=261450 RepID=A0A835HX44_9MAGN|nr:hypothetical protein IFM89_021314 [Coptis chinensis]
MLQEKKSVSSRPLNIAAEKERLRREMEGLDTKAVRLAEMNKKKRAVNFKMASEKKAINTGLKEGEEGYDPFSRRWMRSRNYYVSNTAGGDEAATSQMGTFFL